MAMTSLSSSDKMPSDITYPSDYLDKVGYYDLLDLIASECHSSMGREMVGALTASTSPDAIRHRLERVREMRHLLSVTMELPTRRVADLRATLGTLRAEGSYLTEEELAQVAQAIVSYEAWSRLLTKVQDNGTGDVSPLYPSLSRLVVGSEGLQEIAQTILHKLDPHGRLVDNASPRLAELRLALQREERAIAKLMRGLLTAAQEAGYVEEDAQATMRSGRPVLPVTAMHKRQIPGIVHDESATGKTLYIEPLEVVEANNRIRELESEEHREVIEILRQLTAPIRERRETLSQLYLSMGRIDAVCAIARFADEMHCAIPEVRNKPTIQWYQAVNPILQHTLSQEGKSVVPQDILLRYPNQRILVISGPNAGGKSVCLKTVGLLQYMLQSGIPIPVHPDSVAGVFKHLAIEIGDNQSMEDDLSTYSSHLKHMRAMSAACGANSLLLIDEFGAGTEPELGGAIAEGLLALFNEQRAWGVITTHYRNLKEYATTHKGIVNGAMLYDQKEMKPLYELSIGQPGSSFALEIARQQGLPRKVLEYATELVGQEVIQSERYVQDIVRDKQYWQRKRTEIEHREQKLERLLADYEGRLSKLKEQRQDLLTQAQQEAADLLDQSRAQIERTIREIKESQAERQQTKEARQALSAYSEQLAQAETVEQSGSVERELERLKRRKERKERKRKQGGTPERDVQSSSPVKLSVPKPPKEGDEVRITTMNVVGVLSELSANSATVVVNGRIRITCKPNEIVRLGSERKEEQAQATAQPARTTNVVEHLHERRLDFSDRLDVRGMRAAEAIQAVQYFLDDAISLGFNRVEILHGTGTGALRVSIRELLDHYPGVSHYHDEDVRFGGAGITIVHLQG